MDEIGNVVPRVRTHHPDHLKDAVAKMTAKPTPQLRLRNELKEADERRQNSMKLGISNWNAAGFHRS